MNLDDLQDVTDHREECVACGRVIRSGECVSRTPHGTVCAEHNEETVILHLVETVQLAGSTIATVTMIIDDARVWLGEVAQHIDGSWLALPDKHTEIPANSRDDALLALALRATAVAS